MEIFHGFPMFQKAPKGNEKIEEGGMYRRDAGDATAEIAEVMEVAPDRLGIPHVRYTTYLLRGQVKASAPEQRTLSLECFSARFKERVRKEN